MLRLCATAILFATGGCQDAQSTIDGKESAALTGDRLQTAKGSNAASTESQVSANTGNAKDPVSEAKAELKASHCDDVSDPKFDPDTCLAEPEFRPVEFAGIWKVTKVHVFDTGVPSYDTNDPIIVGARFQISLSEMKWLDTDRDFKSSDVCKGPTVGSLEKSAENEQGDLIGKALATWNLTGAKRGLMYRVGCAAGGSWGPVEDDHQTVFVNAGADKMVLKWHDDTILLAERSR
jgi:uncharacterized protein YjbJ (UPF0337 family)